MVKTKRDKNIELLSTLRQYAPVANRAKINTIIGLYKDNSITNIRTAINTVNLLSSKHKVQQEKAIKTYKANIDQVLNKSSKEANKYTKIINEMNTGHTVNIGVHSKVTSHIDFKIHGSKKYAEGYETRCISEVLGGLRSSLHKELNDALTNKKSFKVASRFTFKVEKDEEEFDKQTMKRGKQLFLDLRPLK